MYFPLGWPKIIDTSAVGDCKINQIACDRVKILLAIIADDFLGIWYTKPLTITTFNKRSAISLEECGTNSLVAWKPDSSMLAVATSRGYLMLYNIEINQTINGVYNHIDSSIVNLRRDSAELFVKESIPSLSLKLLYNVQLDIEMTAIVCVSVSQIMVATKSKNILRIRWDGSEEEDFSIDLAKILFNSTQQCSTPKPISNKNCYVDCMEYSPLVGGFAIILNDGKCGFLTATNLKFEPNEVQGIWAHNIEDATCCSINHKFRLVAFGRKNSQVAVYTVEDTTRCLELSHNLILSKTDFPGTPGAVMELKWSPDGCAVAVAWDRGGISLWSTFGTMLMCTLGWDYALHADLSERNPLNTYCMEWSTEGYQLFLLRHCPRPENISSTNSEPGIKFAKTCSLLQLDFVKSSLCANPCTASHGHIILQGDDKLFISQGNTLEKIYSNSKFFSAGMATCDFRTNENFEIEKALNITSMLAESKHWTIIPLPVAYASTNWPIRYSAIDASGTNLAVAGRTGLAHYSIIHQKWMLFGNETQEKDFVVTGGLLWWKDFIVIGCFSLVERNDEIRIYPKECKLDNRFGQSISLKAPIMLINIFEDRLATFSADGIASVYQLVKLTNQTLSVKVLYEIDIRNFCIHPACIVSIMITNIRNDTVSKVLPQGQRPETLIVNASGRILMIQREANSTSLVPVMSTCLASSVECIWLCNSEKSHMRESIWLYCGLHGMRIWLPVLPCDQDIQRSYRHTFMSKRIMLSFCLKLYPLAILFEDVTILGVENDTVLYTSDSSSHFSIPFCLLERKSQIYLHKILRQLIRRNLGYNAWELARCCTNLPYFPHSLELLLHEVLEDEATSKEPIPDPLLPSVLEFIQEFPVYLQTIVQCARKTEIALWPYLFATVGKPKELFQKCLSGKQLETAASYLIILQNLEPSSISKQYATLLLDTALDNKKWELAKDLVRFLRAIDPNDVESPRPSYILSTKFGLSQQQHQPINPNADDLSLIMGTVTRGRSFSTTMTPKTQNQRNSLPQTTTTNEKLSTTHAEILLSQKRKKSVPNTLQDDSGSAEDFFIEVILQRHARRLLKERKLKDLGYMTAALDFHLVSWLSNENERAARIDDFVNALNDLHKDFDWPKPSLDVALNSYDSDKSSRESHLSLHNNIKNANNILYTRDSGYTSTSHLSQPSFYNTSVNNLITKNGYPFNNRRRSSNGPDLMYKDSSNNIRDVNENSTANSTGVSSLCSEEVPNEDEIAVHSAKARRRVPLKTEVKLRYLLHIFTEANCLEFALIISILLLDAASLSRITNTAIRSGSLPSCRQIRNALKDITRWSLHECLRYSEFMMSLQPEINLLDSFVIQQEAINDFNTEKQSLQSIEENDLRDEETTKTTRLYKRLQSESFSSQKEPTLRRMHSFSEKSNYSATTEKYNSTIDETLSNVEYINNNDRGSICGVM